MKNEEINNDSFERLVNISNKISFELINITKDAQSNKWFGSSNESLVIPFPYLTNTNKRVLSPYENLKKTINKVKTNKEYNLFRLSLDYSEKLISPATLINEKFYNKKNGQNYFKQYPWQLKTYNFVSFNLESKRYEDTDLFNNLSELTKIFSSNEDMLILDLIPIINPENEQILLSEYQVYQERITRLNEFIANQMPYQNNNNIKIEKILSNDNEYYKFLMFYFLKIMWKDKVSHLQNIMSEFIIIMYENLDNGFFISKVNDWVSSLCKKYSKRKIRDKMYTNGDSYLFGFRTYNGGSVNRKQLRRHFDLFSMVANIKEFKVNFNDHDSFLENYKKIIKKYFIHIDSNNKIKILESVFSEKYLNHLWSNYNSSENKATRVIKNEVKNKIRLEQKNICPLHNENKETLDAYFQHIHFRNKNNETYLEFHHIIPHRFSSKINKENRELINKAENIIGLCSVCHNVIEYSSNDEKFKKTQRSILTKINQQEDYVKEIYKNINEEEKKYFTGIEDFKEKIRYL